MRLLPGIPKGSICYQVEVTIYGPSDPTRIGVKPVGLEAFHAWGADLDSAVAAVRAHCLKPEVAIEVINIMSCDAAAGNVVRERIVNDPEYNLGATMTQG